MAQVKITQADIDSIAKRLDDLGKSLSENERAVLLAVFGLAGGAVARLEEEAKAKGGKLDPKQVLPNATFSTAGPLEPLSAGFKRAFTPGRSADVEGQGDPGVDNNVGVSVGGTTVSVSWSNG